MTRHLPRASLFHRLRRAAGALPSGLPTTAAGGAAAVLVSAQLLTATHAGGLPYHPDAARSIPLGAPEARAGALEPLPLEASAVAIALAGPDEPAVTARPRPTATPPGHASPQAQAQTQTQAQARTARAADERCSKATAHRDDGGGRHQDADGRQVHRSDRAADRSCSRHG